MKRWLLSGLIAFGLLASVVGANLVQPDAVAKEKFRPGFNQSAMSVAKVLRCTKPRLKSGSGSMTKSSLVCDLKGRRVNVITFKNIKQQLTWFDAVPMAVDPGRRGHFGYHTGVVIVAKNFNRRSARVGARALGGWVWSADSYWD